MSISEGHLHSLLQKNFTDGLPVEYAWANSHKPEECELANSGQWCPRCSVHTPGGHGIQRMKYATWLEVIEREQEALGGHAGLIPGGNLPQPKERGGEVALADMEA